MRFEQVDLAAGDQHLRTCYEQVISGQAEDDPNVPAMSYGMFRGWWVHGFSGEPRQIWMAAADDGQPLGCYLLDLPAQDNTANAFFEVAVSLPARRQGVGRALVAHAAGQADEARRTLLLSNARVGSPGSAFAEAIGARPGLRDARRILAVGPALSAHAASLRAEAEQHATGYVLRCWTGRAPDDLVAGVCALNVAMDDAPRDAAVEPMAWDADRLRRAEERTAMQGFRRYSVAALHQATGEMAALTDVEIDPDIEGWAFQGLTAVTRPHRGHRLGLLVKAAMLQWLAGREPQIRHIVTFNAVQNEHMVAVNDQLGHRITDYFQSFELDVASAAKLVA